jgi:hypothetical protein
MRVCIDVLAPSKAGHSAERPAGLWLRVMDPKTSRPVRVPEDVYRDLRIEEQARQEAERQARAEAQAHLEAEQRAAQAEARLQALLADLRARPMHRTLGESLPGGWKALQIPGRNPATAEE